jgi:hypothetical protein
LVGGAGFGGATLGMVEKGKDALVDVPLGPYLQKAFNSAVVGTVQAYANGMRDANRLGVYFGTSFMGGLISSTGFFGLGERGGFGGAIAEQMSGSVSQSLLKQVVNPSESLQLSLWGFNVTFGKDLDLEPNTAFLIGQGASFLNSAVSGGWKGVKQGWSWNTLTEKSTGGSLKWVQSILPKGSLQTPKVGVQSVYSLVASLAKGTLDYAGPGLEADFGQSIRDMASSGARSGTERLFEVLAPSQEAKNPKNTSPDYIFFQK